MSLPCNVWATIPQTEKLKWFATNGVQDTSVSASPILDGDVMVSMGGRSNNGIVVRLGGEKGADVTKTHTLSEGKSLACIMTPNRYDSHIYAISKGIASCADAKQVNKFIKNVCLASENRSNAVAPAITTSPRCRRRKTLSVHQKRGCYVVDAPPQFELLVSNLIAEDGSEFNATPAISDGKLFVRSNRRLYCIGAS